MAVIQLIPTPGTNSGKITYNINGLDKHILPSTDLGINITSPGLYALNVSGDTLLSNNLKVSGTTKLCNNTKSYSSLNVQPKNHHRYHGLQFGLHPPDTCVKHLVSASPVPQQVTR